MHRLREELYSLIRKDEAIFEFLQAGSLDGLWYWDLEKPEEEWLSPRFKAVFGYEDHEVPNTSTWWQENIFPEDLCGVLEAFESHLERGSPYDQIVRYRHKDGSTVWVRCRGLAIRDSLGKPVRMLGCHTDVTALKRKEQMLSESNAALKRLADELRVARDEAETANMLKTRFLANMSHEVRTPLNSIIGFTSILLDRKGAPLADAELEYLERIDANGRHLLALINDLLDLSKIEAGHLELELGPVDVLEVTRAAILQLESQITATGARVFLDPGDARQPIEADPRALLQVLENLVNNGVKFAPEGVVELVITSNDDGRPWRIDVTDDGIGIPRDKLESIFEPFHQAHDAANGEFRGTGLGLSISRELCTRMGMTLQVVSCPGRGSRFSIQTADASMTELEPWSAPAARPEQKVAGAASV